MTQTSQAKFSFTVQGLPQDAFHVVRFTGQEGFSRLFVFDVTLVAQHGPVDPEKALEGDACLTVHGENGQETSWRGVLVEFHQLQRVDGRVFHRAVLAPRAWALSMNRQSRIFLDKQTPQILRECFAGAGLSPGHDFDLLTTLPYNKRDYVCQYGETDFAFVSRWMERNGLYFFFDHTGEREKLVVTDNMAAHKPAPGGGALHFREPSGLTPADAGRSCTRLNLERHRLPKDVQLRDYNYRTPGVSIEHHLEIDPAGQGSLCLHGGNMRSAKEAAYLTHLRAQIFRCRERLYTGESDAPFVQPGWVVTLRDHFQDDFNQDYLPVEVTHEGGQEGWLTARMGFKGLGDAVFYRNAFTAIPARTQYRSEQKTPRPWIAGALHAFVDGEATDEYAEIDDQGRYKVLMPFDLSGRKDGKASAWLRMIQPYAGAGHGMHFPLHKGTEVALIFEEGDPDRPVIAGAVPNPLSRSVVTAANQTQSRIHTAGGNQVTLEDQGGGQYVHMSSPVAGTSLCLGAPPAPGGSDPSFTQTDQDELDTLWGNYNNSSGYVAQGGVTLTTQGLLSVKAQTANVLTFGENTQLTVGFYSCSYIGGSFTLNAGISVTLNAALHTEFAPVWREMRGSKRKAEAKKEAVVGSLVTMCGDSNNVAEVVNEVVVEGTKSFAKSSELTAAKEDVLGEVKKTYASKEQLALDEKLIMSDYTTMIARKTANLATKDQVAADVREVAERVERLNTTQTTQAELISKMVGEISTTADVVSVLAAEVGYL